MRRFPGPGLRSEANSLRSRIRGVQAGNVYPWKHVTRNERSNATIPTLFLTLQLLSLCLLLSFSTRKHTSMASRAILSNFFKEQCPQNHTQYFTGLSCALFLTFLEMAVYKMNYPPVVQALYRMTPPLGGRILQEMRGCMNDLLQ